MYEWNIAVVGEPGWTLSSLCREKLVTHGQTSEVFGLSSPRHKVRACIWMSLTHCFQVGQKAGTVLCVGVLVSRYHGSAAARLGSHGPTGISACASASAFAGHVACTPQRKVWIHRSSVALSSLLPRGALKGQTQMVRAGCF